MNDGPWLISFCDCDQYTGPRIAGSCCRQAVSEVEVVLLDRAERAEIVAILMICALDVALEVKQKVEK